jgi:hypothetical protein
LNREARSAAEDTLRTSESSQQAAHPGCEEQPRSALKRTLLAAAVSVALLGTQAAQASRVMSVSDEGHLHYLRSSGNEIIDEGHVSGTMPGRVLVHFSYDGNPSVSAHFTIYSAAGSISGSATGQLSNPTSASPSFRAALTLSGGGGRYARAHGHGELYGVYYRRSYAMTVQTRGTVRY